MRQYFVDLLQASTPYKRRMRNIKKKHKFLLECSTELTEKLGFESIKTTIPFYIASVAFPFDMKKTLKKAAALCPEEKELMERQVEKIDILQKAMSKFSVKILNDFFSFPEMSYLVLHYLSKVKNQKYEGFYEMLKKTAEESIEDHQSTESGRSESTEDVKEEERVYSIISGNRLF